MNRRGLTPYLPDFGPFDPSQACATYTTGTRHVSMRTTILPQVPRVCQLLVPILLPAQPLLTYPLPDARNPCALHLVQLPTSLAHLSLPCQLPCRLQPVLHLLRLGLDES